MEYDDQKQDTWTTYKGKIMTEEDVYKRQLLEWSIYFNFPLME